jgi:rRNA-processing protein EBP2
MYPQNQSIPERDPSFLLLLFRSDNRYHTCPVENINIEVIKSITDHRKRLSIHFTFSTSFITMAKKKSKAVKKQNSPASKAKEERVTMKALEEMSDSEDDEAVPESQWTTKAKNLRQEIEGGKFDKLLGVLEKANGEEDEFEEDSLGSSEDDEEVAEVKDEAMEEEEEDQKSESEEEESENVETTEAAEADGGDDNPSEEEEEEDSDEDEEDDKLKRLAKNNQINSKALGIVTAELAASHANLPWAETYHVFPATPLPFGQKADEDGSPMDIHDDLKREVAFYNCALEAVHDARSRCKEANIPFSRPEDFFAEMIKTDGKLKKLTMNNAIEMHCETNLVFLDFRSYGKGEGQTHLRNKENGSCGSAKI